MHMHQMHQIISPLLAIKAHVIFDPNNFITTNWSRGTSFCTWIGVTCSARHTRVAALDLFNMSLQGTIAPDIGNLTFLVFVNLCNNSFTGLTPDEMGNLRRLRSLKMWSNQLSGSVPRSIFNISSLTEISLAFNMFSGSLPPLICPSATRLVRLDFWSNQLTGNVPRGLSDCAALEILYLSFNNFSGSLPADIGNLSKLRIIAFQRNQLTGTIPPSLGNLSNLNMLSLSENYIEGTIPPEMGNLFNLTLLNLATNKLEGQLPPSMFNLSRLQSLGLTKNELSGSIPRSIGEGLPSLQDLYIALNQFTGEIPNSILNLSRLTALNIGSNSFNGLIPNNLGSLRDLEIVTLYGNMFVNDLSVRGQEFFTSLTNCSNLRSLYIGGSPIVGLLPKSLGNLSASLEYLFIASTRISGTIPDEIGNLYNLVELQLGHNDLSGKIPEALGRLINLQLFTVSGNRLHGTIPNSICNLEKVFKLSLGNNMFTGHLPRCIGILHSLRELNLSNNYFSFSIPSTLWSNPDLQILSLSRNLFQGSLPNEIGNLKELMRLDLHGNQFSGSIPNVIGQLESLTHLIIQNNKFNGSIPSSFGNLLALQYLDLSRNNLIGSIPNSLETLEGLDYFNVSFNQLSGEIPNGGNFKNFRAGLFMGNKGLCGASRFGVETCERNELKSSRKNKLLRYILPPVASVIVLSAILIFLLRRRVRNPAFSSTSSSFTGLTNERISYYEILRATSNFDEANLIGKGSIGSVYKGTFSNETNAAIKVFNLDVQGAFKSFDTECQTLRSLRHRNLVKVITSCSNPDFKALVMEYMSSGNLDIWLYRPNYPSNIEERLRIMIDVASAMEYLHHGHASHVVHCDLKPSNILLDEDMVAHVADFGISKLIKEDQRMEQTKTLGTIGYMAPEYGSAGLVSTKVDVYSYGILLMEIFTKKKPTDEIFLGELTLKEWVSESFPSTVTQIIDAELLNTKEDKVKNVECLMSIINIAIECAAESPEQRPDMKDILVRLKKINMKLHINAS